MSRVHGNAGVVFEAVHRPGSPPGDCQHTTSHSQEAHISARVPVSRGGGARARPQVRPLYSREDHNGAVGDAPEPTADINTPLVCRESPRVPVPGPSYARGDTEAHY